MNKAAFDKIIKRNLIENGKAIYTDFREDYPNYFTQEAFKNFTDEMETDYPKAYARYSRGKGSELKDRKYPAKMSSVASSSRFCYLALRDGAEALCEDGNKTAYSKENVVFEADCPIKYITEEKTVAHPDAYIPGAEVYVEAKCHEIFDGRHYFKPKYYDLLVSEQPELFEFTDKNIIWTKDKKSFVLDLFSDSQYAGTHIKRFDYKQLICHLLGIASTKASQETKCKLIYLFFWPLDKEYQSEIDKVFEELKKEIKLVFENKHIKKFCDENNIELDAVAERGEIMDKLTKAIPLYNLI